MHVTCVAYLVGLCPSGSDVNGGETWLAAGGHMVVLYRKGWIVWDGVQYKRTIEQLEEAVAAWLLQED